MITITPPKCETYIPMVFRSMNYFNAKQYQTMFHKGEEYYISLHRGQININLVSKTEENIKEIEDYLSYMFDNKYIGLDHESFQYIHPNNVESFEIE